MFGQQSNKGQAKLGKLTKSMDTLVTQTVFSLYHHLTADPTINSPFTTQYFPIFQPCFYLSNDCNTALF